MPGGIYTPLYTHDQFEGLQQFILNSGSIEMCSQIMSMRVKQRAVIKFLTAENIISTEIHRRLKAIYDENAVE